MKRGYTVFPGFLLCAIVMIFRRSLAAGGRATGSRRFALSRRRGLCCATEFSRKSYVAHRRPSRWTCVGFVVDLSTELRWDPVACGLCGLRCGNRLDPPTFIVRKGNLVRRDVLDKSCIAERYNHARPPTSLRGTRSRTIAKKSEEKSITTAATAAKRTKGQRIHHEHEASVAQQLDKRLNCFHPDPSGSVYIWAVSAGGGEREGGQGSGTNPTFSRRFSRSAFGMLEGAAVHDVSW